MAYGDECWRNNGCPSTPPNPNGFRRAGHAVYVGPAPLASPSAEPEVDEAEAYLAGLPLDVVRKVLSCAGLAIVDDGRLRMLERHWERTKCDAAEVGPAEERAELLSALQIQQNK